MRQRQITANIVQLNRFRFVNAYLVREDDGFTLVDSTLPGAADELIAAAKAAGGSIRRIALTHGHGDHIGSVDALRDRLGAEVPVLLAERDQRRLAGEKTFDGKKVPGAWPKVTTAFDGDLPAGTRVGSLEVIANPGHTPGHVAFLDTRDRTVIAGDTVAAIGGLAVTSHYRTRFPLPATAAWNKPAIVESARALRALNPAVLVMGHGPAITDPGAQLDAAIATAERHTSGV